MSEREEYRKRARQAQGGGASLKLPILIHFEAKADKAGKPGFKWLDKNVEDPQKRVKSMKSAVNGYLLGTANMLTYFCTELNRSYRSAFYWSNKYITLYKPSARGSELVVKGNKEEVEAWLAQNATGNIKVHKVLFVLTESGIVTMETNMTLFIDQVKSFDRDTFLDYMIVLSPKKYSPDDQSITNDAKGILGPFAETNPPTYANMGRGEEITDELFKAREIAPNIDAFNAWKDERVERSEGRTEETEPATAGPQPAQEGTDDAPDPAPPAETGETEDKDDDLPF